MDRKRIISIGIGVVAVVAVVAAAVRFGPWGDDEGPGIDARDPATLAALGFAANWQSGTLDKTPFTAGSGDVASATAIITAGLGAIGPGPSVEVTEVDEVESDPRRRRADLAISWDLGRGRTWDYASTVDLIEEDGNWVVDWVPATIEPSLQTGEYLRATRTPAKRGHIVDTEGNRLTAGEATVSVFFQKEGVDDPRGAVLAAAALVGVDGEALAAEVEAASPVDLVEVAELPRADYDRIREEIRPLPGTRFEENVAEPATVAPGYAAAVIGTVVQADAALADASDGKVREGERVGLDGLQAGQEEVLGGAPALSVEAVPPEGISRALKSWAAEDGTNVTVTLDVDIQTAADAVAAESERPATIIAIDVSSGDVLAIAHASAGGAGTLLDPAAPGSVFTTASSLALLVDGGMTSESAVDCPGRGQVPFRIAYATACDAAFTGLASSIDADALARAATALGYGDLDIGLDTRPAAVGGDGDLAAQMIGQGTVSADALHVATSSASVAAARRVDPRLIVGEDAPEESTEEPEAELDPVAVDQLRSMMRATVVEGTGQPLLDVPGGDVSARTGTAEVADAQPPRTDSWITGFQGDVAFAIVVDDGGPSPDAAVRLAASFLTRLAA